MLKICAKTLWRCQALKHTYRVLALQNYATFGARDILNETSDEAGTLLTRFTKHVALERQKVCDQVASTVRYSDYFPISDLKYFCNELHKTDKEQIATVIIYAFTYRPNADPAKFAIILNELDRYAEKNIGKMSSDTILRTLYAFMFLIPNWMTRLDFYYRAMERLCEEFDKQKEKSKEQFIQLCFYMGLSKKQKNVNNLLSSFLDNHLGEYLKEMNSLDMALVSNAAYKTSTVINMEDFNQRLMKEVQDISDFTNGNDALLVTFIKSMRLQRLRSPKICEYIESICQNNEKLQQLQMKGKVHLLAYLAENLWDSKQCTQPLIEAITEHLTASHSDSSSDSYSRIPRGKDICTFLWSCAQLGCELSLSQLQYVEKTLLQRVNRGEFDYFPDQLVDSCLSLWILGYKSKQLLHLSVDLKSNMNVNRKQPKVESRLTVLLSAANIEEPDWCANLVKDFQAFNTKAAVPSHIGNNNDIPFKKIVKELLEDEKVSSASISCPINGINIPGIHIISSDSNENQTFLEFISPAQQMQFSQQPVGILRLKMRLLEALGHKVKLVSTTEELNKQSLIRALYDSDVPEETADEPSKTSIKA